MAEASYAAAFIAGFAGFASPCVLPLVPSYLAYISGVASSDAPGARRTVFLNTLAFVLGLALALSALGFALGSVLQYLTGDMLLAASRISGAIITFFGLFILGFFRPAFLSGRKGLALPGSASVAASFAVGALFALAWTPVMGAFLAFVIALAISAPQDAPALLFCYACGLGLPFLIAGAFAAQASGFIKRHGKEMAVFDRAMGLMVVVVGILLMLGGIPGA